MPAIHELITRHLRVLVDEIGARPPGSPANREAGAYAREVLAGCDLEVSEAPFTTRWWEPGAGWLQHGTERIELRRE